MVKLDTETRKIPDMRLLHFGDDLFLRPSLLLCPNTDRRAMSVIRADIDAAVPPQFLKSHPNIRLQILDQMADVNMPVGIWQS